MLFKFFMKHILLFLGLGLLLSSNVSGQAVITSVSSCSSYTLTGTITGLAPTSSGITEDDVWSNVIPIGFTYNFYGVANTECIIGSNGCLGFTLSNALAYNTWPISATLMGTASSGGGSGGDIYNMIAGPWCDIYIPAGGTIMYSTVGTAPNRKFEVTYCGVAMFSCTAQWITTQTIIYETTGVAEVHIGHHTFCTSWNGGYAETGVVNSTGSSATVAPGEDYPTNWTATNIAWRFTPVGTTSFTVSSIPYAPIPYSTGTIYWYDSATHAYLGSGPSITVSPTVTTTYEAAVLGCKDTAKTYYTVGPVSGGSTAAINGTAGMCLGGTTTLTDATAGGTWTSTNTLVATVNSSGLVSSVGGGTTTISYTFGACSSTEIVTVNTVGAITGVANICAGGTSTLADAVTGGTWTSSNTGVATIGLTSGTVNAIAPGSTVITYVTAAGCVTTTTVDVFVLSTIGGTKTVCQGSTTTLSETSGGGTWTSANSGIASIGSGTGVVTGVAGGTTNITYSTGGGCYVTTVVTVNPLSPITGTLTMCQNYGTTLADALTGGTWSSSNPSVAVVNSSTGFVYGLTGGTATISYTSVPGCLMTTVVTVHPKPANPVPTPQTYCSNFIPSAVAATPTTGLTWYGPGLTPGTTVNPTPAAFPPLTAETITYYVTETSAFGCVSDSAIDVVHVIAQPTPPVTHQSEYCQYSPVAPLNSQVDSLSGSYLTWFTLGGAAYAGTPPLTDSVANYPFGAHWLVEQTVNGCTSTKDTVTVITVYKPSFSIAANRLWVCDHDTLTFAYSSSAPLIEGSYMWALPVGGSLVEGNDTSDAIAVKFDSVNGQHIVYLTVGELHNMCTTTVSVQVTVESLPTATGYTNPNVCLGDTTSLSLSSESPSASIFGWFIDGTPLDNTGAVSIIAANSNSGGPYSIRWNATGLHIIEVTTTTDQGCKSAPTFDSVDVHALPDATFTFKAKFNSTLCLEDSVEFIANDTAYNDSYLWQPAHGFNNDNKRVIWGKVEQAQSDITLTVTDPFGCVGTSTQQLDPSVCCSVMFPNAFTPNGDGKNDVFHPLFNGYHNFHSFRIVNRWGQTIFESSNSLPAWDGTFNGVPQDIGTYYYFIQYDCGGNTIEAKGDVTLIR